MVFYPVQFLARSGDSSSKKPSRILFLSPHRDSVPVDRRMGSGLFGVLGDSQSGGNANFKTPTEPALVTNKRFGSWKMEGFPGGRDYRSTDGTSESGSRNAGRHQALKISDLVRTARWFSAVHRILDFLGIMPGILFRTKGRTQWFGFSLEPGQAQEILARLRLQMPQSAFAVTQNALSFTEPLEEE